MSYRNNKFNAQKVYLDGMAFDSRKEANRYAELKLLERAGLIQNLQRQVKFELVPAQHDENNKVVERKVDYVADFVYTQNGEQVVEDVKGYKGSIAYQIFVIKRKLMLYNHGIKVKEV